MAYQIANTSRKIHPFSLPNDFVEYFYYPINASGANSQEYPFSIIKENQLISAVAWDSYVRDNTSSPIRIQVPKLTIVTWSGIAMQCYLITNNMACTLLLPAKYQGKVDGLAFNRVTTLNDSNAYCRNGKKEKTCHHR